MLVEMSCFTIAGADGSYRIELEPGAYRAFVRDDSVLSIGFPVEERLPGFPDLDAIGAPDETAMPLVVMATFKSLALAVT